MRESSARRTPWVGIFIRNRVAPASVLFINERIQHMLRRSLLGDDSSSVNYDFQSCPRVLRRRSLLVRAFFHFVWSSRSNSFLHHKHNFKYLRRVNKEKEEKRTLGSPLINVTRLFKLCRPSSVRNGVIHNCLGEGKVGVARLLLLSHR